MRVVEEGGRRSRDIANDMTIKCQLIQEACSSYEFYSLLTPSQWFDVSARCCLSSSSFQSKASRCTGYEEHRKLKANTFQENQTHF